MRLNLQVGAKLKATHGDGLFLISPLQHFKINGFFELRIVVAHGVFVRHLLHLQSLSNALPPLLAGLIAAHLTPEAPITIGAFICLVGWMAFGLATRTAKEA